MKLRNLNFSAWFWVRQSFVVPRLALFRRPRFHMRSHLQEATNGSSVVDWSYGQCFLFDGNWYCFWFDMVTSCARFWEAVPLPSQAVLEWGLWRRPLVLMAVFTTRPITFNMGWSTAAPTWWHLWEVPKTRSIWVNMDTLNWASAGCDAEHLCEFGVTRACQMHPVVVWMLKEVTFWENVRSHSACTAWESNCLSSAKLMEGWKFPKPPRWLTSLQWN